MADYSKLKQLLGNLQDTDESPYQTYDKMIERAYRNVLQNRADTLVKKINDPRIPIQPGSQSRNSGLENAIPEVLNENLNVYETQKDYIKKTNPKTAEELYDIDRYPIASYISKNILKTTNPEIIQNAKVSESDIEKLDTAKRIHDVYEPLIKEAVDTMSSKNPTLQESLATHKKYLQKEYPQLKYGESQISKNTLPAYSNAYGAFTKYSEDENVKPGDITLNEDVLTNPIKNLGTIPHEIMHSYFPTRGGESLAPLELNSEKTLRKQLDDINSGHISTSPWSSDEYYRQKEVGVRPSGETYVLNEIIKNILKGQK